MAERQHRKMDRRSFMRRAGGTALALPTASAILAACSKPGTDGRRHRQLGTGRRGATRRSGHPSPQRRTDPDRHPDRGRRHAAGLQLERLLLSQGARGVRRAVRRQDRMDHLQQHGGRDPEAGRGPGQARRVLPDHRLHLPARADGPAPAAEPRPAPQHGQQRVAVVLRPGPVVRPGVAVHRPLRDLHHRGGLSPRPHRRQRRAGEGLRAALGPRVHGQDQLLRLLPRRPGHGDAPQRRPRPQQRRPRRDRPGPRGGQRDRGTPPGQAHDQRHVRETARGRVLRHPGVVR